jgi:signal recognition particle receptor subunit beta
LSARRVVRNHGSIEDGPMRPLKIVITGPFSAGKTTLIETISEIAIVDTEKDVTDDSRGIKSHTTVAMDFGRITFEDGASLFLFGTPGQRRFQVMWEVLAEGMIGFIVLVNGSDSRSGEEARHILRTFHEYADVPYVVGVTHLDRAHEPQIQVLDRIRRQLLVPDDIQLIPSDVRDREDVKQLILATLHGVMKRLDIDTAAAD